MFGEWLSLVEHLVRDQGVGGSNPLAPTNSSKILVLFNSYSDRTKCPECHTRVRLEDVKFTPAFPCPHCDATIGVSDIYQRTMIWTVAILALLLPYLLGARSWLLLALLWCPSMFVLIFLWAYAGKYWLPPKLVRSVVDRPSILGLGSGRDSENDEIL